MFDITVHTLPPSLCPPQLPLVQACFEGNVVQLSELAGQRSEDINSIDSEKRTPMHAAAYCGEKDCITAIVQAGWCRCCCCC